MSTIEIDKRYPYQHKNSLMKLIEWKQAIFDVLCNDNDISRLLFYPTKDALTKPLLTEEQKYDLVGTHIIDGRFKPQTVEEQTSWIGVDIANWNPQETFHQFSQRFGMGYINFYIFCDMEIQETYGGSRRDLIASRLYDLFQDKSGLGIGHTQLENFDVLYDQNNKFGGYIEQFKMWDLR